MILRTAKLASSSMINLMLVVLFALGATTALAQDPQPQPSGSTAMNAIEQLHLMPEQRQRIRAIREETKQQRALINLRLREANIALEQALDVDNPDDGLIEQRLGELAAAQTESMRMRIQTEVRIRRILTQEQLVTLRQLRLQARGLMRQPNQRNGIAPLFPRRNVQRPPRP